jgi:nitrite reductase/ring-hydroxylating ferredoxin subunit
MTQLDNTSCNGCALVARRDFVRDAARATLAVLVGLGAAPAAALAAPIDVVTPSKRRSGDEHSYAMPASDGVQIDKENATMLTRWQGKVYVYSLGCPHQNTALRWNESSSEFECPKHHSRFHPDGEYEEGSGRAKRGLDRFPVRRDGESVVANLDRVLQQYDDAADWANAFVNV